MFSKILVFSAVLQFSVQQFTAVFLGRLENYSLIKIALEKYFNAIPKYIMKYNIQISITIKRTNHIEIL